MAHIDSTFWRDCSLITVWFTGGLGTVDFIVAMAQAVVTPTSDRNTNSKVNIDMHHHYLLLCGFERRHDVLVI